MLVSAIVSLAIAVPSFAQPAKSRRSTIWELGVSLSAGVVYRMDTIPAQNKDGNDMLAHARGLAAQLARRFPLPKPFRAPRSTR